MNIASGQNQLYNFIVNNFMSTTLLPDSFILIDNDPDTNKVRFNKQFD